MFFSYSFAAAADKKNVHLDIDVRSSADFLINHALIGLFPSSNVNELEKSKGNKWMIKGDKWIIKRKDDFPKD